MQERDLEYTQLEDKSSVLGMAKDIGLSFFNPFYRPGLFKLRQGALSLAPVNSVMGITKFLSNKIDGGQFYNRLRKSIYDSRGYEFLAAMEQKSYYAPFKGSWKGSTTIHYSGNKLEDMMSLNRPIYETAPPPEPEPIKPLKDPVRKKTKSRKQKKQKIINKKIDKVFDQRSSDAAFDRAYERSKLRRSSYSRANQNSSFIQSTNRVMTRMEHGVGDFAKKNLGKASNIGRIVARGGARVGIAALKGLAYYNVLSLAYDVTSWAAEPLGRSMINMIDYGSNRVSNITRPELGGSLPISYLSQGAATERQRAINAISKAGINGRSNLGREASFL